MCLDIIIRCNGNIYNFDKDMDLDVMTKCITRLMRIINKEKSIEWISIVDFRARKPLKINTYLDR